MRMKFGLATILLVVVFAGMWSAGAVDLNVRETMLDNGMKVISVERPGAPVVSFALYYRTGSIDEKEGKRGIAHYMEHMMFKKTRYLESEEYSRLVGSMGGGDSNANTSFDRTMYYATVPSSRLELIIRLESERMANLNPDREESRKELQVVMEELRLNYLDDPMGRLRFELYRNAFKQHPYRIITIGTLEDLETVTYEDLMEFYREYYHPARAVAVVAGDFKTDELIKLMNAFFGPIPAGRTPVREYPQEPPQTEEVRFELKMPVQHPALMMGYKAPKMTDNDSLALMVLSNLLARGGSSPFGQLTKGSDGVAMHAIAYYQQLLDPGLLLVQAMPMPGISLQELESRVTHVIDDVINNGITDADFERTRNQLLAADVYEMQSTLGIVRNLGENEMTGSWQAAIDFESDLKNLSRESVEAAARKYLVPSNRTVGYLLPEDSGQTPEGALQ